MKVTHLQSGPVVMTDKTSVKVAYLVKGPDILPALEKWKKISDLTVVSCIPAYIDYYRYKGYNTISIKNYLALDEDTMHFTHALANPPFSDRSSNSNNTADLDSKFNEKSRKICKNVHMVIRTKHFTNPKSKFRKRLFSSESVVEIRYLPKETFPSILNTETCVLVTRDDHKGPSTIKYPDGTVRVVNLTEDTVLLSSDPDYAGPVKNSLAKRWIRGKVNRDVVNDGPDGIDIVEIMGNGDSPVIRKVDPSLTQIGYNQHGVVMNINTAWGSLGRIYVKKYDTAISNSVICLKTDSEEESIALCKYLQTDEVKDIVEKTMPSFHPTKTVFSNIPDPL
jgi:hypothetical protein